jgi:hypothetical protein
VLDHAQAHTQRSNRVVFFDDECARVLRRWLAVREKLKPKTRALFVSYETLDRLSRNGVWTLIDKYARRLGFHNPDSPRLEDHFNAHCFRYWFTTWLLRNGMPREYVKELRLHRTRALQEFPQHVPRGSGSRARFLGGRLVGGSVQHLMKNDLGERRYRVLGWGAGGEWHEEACARGGVLPGSDGVAGS